MQQLMSQIRDFGLGTKPRAPDTTQRKPRVIVLTGAGVSAPSGLATFRNDPDSFWTKYPSDLVCHARTRHTLEHFDFINTYRQVLKSKKPNPAHVMLADLQREYGSRIKLYTTNIDDLHEIAGSPVTHLHGRVTHVKCDTCVYVENTGFAEFVPDTPCPKGCGIHSELRTEVLLFGEKLTPQYDVLLDELQSLTTGDLFLCIGCSFSVFPFHEIMKSSKATKINVTLDTDEETSSAFDHTYTADVVTVLEKIRQHVENVLEKL